MGSVGFAAWSSQHTLPFMAYNSSEDSFGAGPARINIRLRCGSSLPYILRLGFFEDLTRDGKVNADDGRVWTRSQYPLADWLYRAGLFTKIQSDATSYLTHATQPRITFNRTLAYAAQMSRLSDRQPLVIALVGWQGTGDTRVRVGGGTAGLRQFVGR